MSSVKALKRSAFSCSPCRKRKVKCGGEQPVCQRCAARNDECVYKLNPTLSYTQRLEERIKELEDQLASSTCKSSTHSSPSASHGGEASSNDWPRASADGDMLPSFHGLKIDEKGGITYHGATSFFNLPTDRPTTSAVSDLPPSAVNDVQRRQRLVNNAWHQRALENMSDIPEPFQYLLNVHWCWIQPLFNFIYRPAFTRDMQSMGSYYSHTLLNAVISHSVRWVEPATKRLLDESYDGGAVFAKYARSMVLDEISRGICTIPTVQTLLLLSAQECSLGNSTQAWTYSGLAFRLIDHLGICVDTKRFPGSVPLTDQDLEIRHRIFWSSYLWDKLISLYLGRSPSLQQSNKSPPLIMFDDSAEEDLWIPFGAQQASATWKYPPTTAHSASCFVSMCRLAVIFNEILVHMYDPLSQNTDAEAQECFSTQEPAFQEWWAQLPAHLRIDIASLPAVAPPSHIVTLNCLYHTFKILLYRPMLTGRAKRSDDRGNGPSLAKAFLVEMVTSATAVITIFDLFCRTYSIKYCILSMAYSVYIAASVFLLQVQASPGGDQPAMMKLEYCIQCLSQMKNISPVINCALVAINKELAAMGIGSEVAPPSRQQSQPPTGSSVMRADPVYRHSPADLSRQWTMASHSLFQPVLNNDEAMNPGVFETMSTLQPLTVRVGAITDAGTSQESYTMKHGGLT
ncbi:hypothetical protein CDD82_1453 [Ophiocordyceps australis]|uniref:Zn(2)-C6 fungal-type domain-containing protein n=1 Tax=Ophiocordyceps australis TaxID=1399860 RepID=A0A2C5ZM10_9HYPO|nr:hypothetical protein CDD82_1453 [Ophiocordyceps australis]